MPEFYDGLTVKQRLELRNKMIQLNQRRRELEHMMMQIDDERLRVWYKLKMSDSDIAEILCREEITSNAYRRNAEECIRLKILMVKRWCERNNLKPNAPHSDPFESVNESRLKDYEDGMTDSELADKWGVSSSTVGGWRRGFDLGPNKRGGENAV